MGDRLTTVLLNYVCQELRSFHPQPRKAGSTLDDMWQK
jgi:hypothetical protein